MHPKGKVCVVTGAASGIGEAVARAFAAAGARGVAVADLNAAKLANVAAEIGGERQQTRRAGRFERCVGPQMPADDRAKALRHIHRVLRGTEAPRHYRPNESTSMWASGFLTDNVGVAIADFYTRSIAR